MPEFFTHEKAICETTRVGPRTRIWAFAHILPGAAVGADCNICDHVFIENEVTVGDRVTVKCGVQLWDGLTLEDDVFVGPNATFTNDRFPRSRVRPVRFLRTIVRNGASIGANATILPGIEIGAGAMIAAGAVVTRSVPPNAIAAGNPARIVGYVDSSPGLDDDSASPAAAGRSRVRRTPVGVGQVTLYDFPWIKDIRGDLTVGEFEKDLPFRPKRYFMVFGVPSRETRGEHAHRTCHQLLLCAHGTCAVVVDDGRKRREFLLDKPTLGIHVPPLVWGTQYKYSKDAVLLVFASEHYDPDDYIRDYTDFLSIVGQRDLVEGAS